ncbi:Protein of unknown function [Mariniphaga anaerophila]|uniref:DUF3810 domain-containing protein n=1 Tax=Mariniphaga anaerophila TaxID=1484053 RepID=A0A1M5B7C9_9BACT|nr:DUF3810 domain-containing protein [Mariniphaga anaerophila]SHF38423.1 Protein of unknown function [Mariniphaga anaerophila]
MTTQNKKIRNLRWIATPVFALITFLLTELAARNPAFVERYYSRGIYPVIASVFSFISSRVAFSLDDLFYGLLILLPLFLLLLAVLKRMSWKAAGKILLNSLAGIYIAFYFLWGFNYYRSDFNQRLGLAEQRANTDAFVAVLDGLAEKLSADWTGYENMKKEHIDSLVEESYKRIAPALKLQYPSGKRRAKNITAGMLFAQAGISGYYGPFFNEVHVNPYNLPVEYPFVLAHEKAHQFGITSEAEANFYAWLVCTQSSSKQLRYSANLVIFRYFLFHGSRLEQIPGIAGKLDEKVKTDFRRIREHWVELRNEKIDRAASKVNDAYLKSNKVTGGIEDYTGVVKFVMDFSADSAFQSKVEL